MCNLAERDSDHNTLDFSIVGFDSFIDVPVSSTVILEDLND